MKKSYMTPATTVVEVELQHIIAASLNGIDENGGTTTLTTESAEDGAEGWSRRGGSIWDDEEDY